MTSPSLSQQSPLITPISGEQQQQVIEASNVYIEQAVVLFDVRARPVDIVFDLKGRNAGMYRVKQQGRLFNRRCQREIRYNPFIFAKYFDDNMRTTVPHEVAHYIADIIYGLKNIKPHGKEWKDIMRVFNADASVTADYDLSGIPLRQKKLFCYRCACREHQLSSVRHNRIVRERSRYHCKICKQPLQRAVKV